MGNRTEEYGSLQEKLDNIFVRRGGWDKIMIYWQEGGWPVYAYKNGDEIVKRGVISLIHGSEESGVWMLAEDYAKVLVDLGWRETMLVIPMANPWGLVNSQRYGPKGLSVGDMDKYCRGSANCPASLEAKELSRFLSEIKTRKNVTRILDIHDDGLWEDDGNYIDSSYSYYYLADPSGLNYATAERIATILRENNNPLPKDAWTRFGERVIDGMVMAEDGSIDHFMAAELGISVVTTEITRKTPFDPTLEYRKKVHALMTDAFLGIEGRR